jgi:hypothetical protein
VLPSQRRPQELAMLLQQMRNPSRNVSRPPSSRSSSSGRSASSGEFTSGTNQRVTVPMPRSLMDLQDRAMHLFGNNGELKLFHHGKPIKDPQQLAGVHNGDTVVVTWDDRRLTPAEFSQLLTTQQADYVQHPLPPKAPTSKALPVVTPRPFEGRSSYQEEYTKLPVCKRGLIGKPADSWKPTESATGNTSYAEEFPWHDAVPARRQRALSMDTSRESHPFIAQTSYMQEFVKPPPGQKTTATRPRPRTPQALPFEGVSTYEAEYVEHPNVETIRQVRPLPVKHEALPFEGTSEYRNEFLKKEVEQAVIHLESGRSSTRTSSKSSRTSSSSRRRVSVISWS